MPNHITDVCDECVSILFSFAAWVYWQGHYTMWSPDEAPVCLPGDLWRGKGCTGVEGNWEMRWVISEWHGEQSVNQYPLSYWTDSAALPVRRRGDIVAVAQCLNTPPKIILQLCWVYDNDSLLFKYCCLPVLFVTRCRASWLSCCLDNSQRPPTHPPEALNRKHWLATRQGRFRSDKGSVKSLPCSVWSSSYCIFLTGRDWRRGIKAGVGRMGTLFICPRGRQREQGVALIFFPFIFYLSPKTKTKSLDWYNWCWICSPSGRSDSERDHLYTSTPCTVRSGSLLIKAPSHWKKETVCAEKSVSKSQFVDNTILLTS